MLLFNGELLPDDRLYSVLEQLKDFCCQAVESGRPDAKQVIHACSRLSDNIKNGYFDHIITPLLSKGRFTKTQLEEAVTYFQKEHMEFKYRTELGILEEALDPLVMPSGITIQRSYVPLGVLLHIAAGNAEGLPFYSVIEGLLAGNVNLLKLPSADDGLSVLLLRELIKEEPALAPYIAVFDIPSTDTPLLKKLEEPADAIVVWGSDTAVRAARQLAKPSTRVISWGHKLSFAYLTLDADQKELRGLASHICETNQLLCSSCQGIFVDTDDMADIRTVGIQFLRLLEEERATRPALPIGIRGKISLSLYNEELEAGASHRELLRGKGASVILSGDSSPELSYLFGNCWIKPLPRSRIVRALRPSSGLLQTIGLLCSPEDRGFLSGQLIRAGAVRITCVSDMSRTIPGEAHDGEYALRRYTRLAETEYPSLEGF